MDNQKLTQFLLTLLGWNYEHWMTCPRCNHLGLYTMGSEWEGKLLREDYRCPSCGGFSLYVCLTCFSQNTRLEGNTLECFACGASQPTHLL